MVWAVCWGLGVAHGQNVVGLNIHLPPDDVLDAAAASGVTWVRIDNNWNTVEQAQGRYSWGQLDRVVNGAIARGLRVYMTVAYTPAWAAGGGSDDWPGNDPPPAAAYRDYVRATVERYRDRVQHFGLWNEPNLEHFFEGTLAEYIARVVNPGAQAVRAACPNCQVLGPDLAGLSGWQPYMTEVLRAAPDAFDIIAHHSYARVPGVGGALWACDDFEHAIDIGDDAICFYKPGLRQVLDEAGWQGEVWMTEVGHQTEPWDSDQEQEWQRLTVESILALQRRTPWWTHTFFYEIADCGPTQPDCPIDGFGLIRRTAGPDGTWGDNFLLKPAFIWLQDTLQDPGWGEPVDPPPPMETPEIQAPQRPAGLADGRLDDWDAAGCVILDQWAAVQDAPRPNAGDLSARACAAWSDAALWLAVEVNDDTHQNDAPEATLWQGDSVQLALDVDADGRPGVGYDGDDSEWTVALSRGDSEIHIEFGERGAAGVVRREGNRTLYELRVPLPNLRAGQRVNASFLVNERDGDAREGWLEWTSGIGREKRPAEFGTILLVPRAAEPPPMPPPDMGVDPEPGPQPEPSMDLGVSDAMLPPVDAGVMPDGALADAALVDGTAIDATPGNPPAASAGDDDGGCQTVPGTTGGWFGLLGLLALRRRKHAG
jgi:hypothetical protein